MSSYVLECKLEDLNTAWSLHRWTLWWKCSHSSIRRDFSWSTSCIRLRCFPTSGNLPRSGQDCWLATELEQWSLVFQKLTAARSHAPVGRSVVLLKSKEFARQVANGWQKLLLKQDISIILAVHICTLINEKQVGMPQTAHSNRHHHRPRERRTGSHNTSLPSSDCSKQRCIGNRDILLSVFED